MKFKSNSIFIINHNINNRNKTINYPLKDDSNK
jgi:hypothetical protein